MYILRTRRYVSRKKEEEKFHNRTTMRIIDRIRALYFYLSWKEMYLVRRMTSNVEDEDEEDEEPLNLSSIPLINRQQWIVRRFDPSVPRRWWWISAILSIFGTYRCYWNRTSRAEVKELFRGMAFPDARCYRLLLLPLYPYGRRNLSKMATNPSAIRMVNKG